jgi:hypothetical protein
MVAMFVNDSGSIATAQGELLATDVDDVTAVAILRSPAEFTLRATTGLSNSWSAGAATVDRPPRVTLAGY